MEGPDLLEKHGARDDLAGVAHEIFEQLEFLRLQHDRLARANRAPLQEVDRKIADLQPRRRIGELRPPCQGAEPCRQLAQGERLDDIIVGARLQPLDTVVDFTHGREQDSRRSDPRRPERLEDTETIHAGDHPIEDQRRMRSIGTDDDSVASGRATIDDMPHGFETTRHVIAKLAVILEKQEFHAVSVACIDGPQDPLVLGGAETGRHSILDGRA